MTEPPATDEPHADGPASDPAAAGSDPGPDASAEDDGKFVIRDRRKVGRHRGRAGTKATGQTSTDEVPDPDEVADEAPESAAPADSGPTDAAGPAEADAATPDEPTGADTAASREGGLGAELASLRTALEERTRDVQRVSAEYANYRKRVERDRSLVTEQATGQVLSALLPVLDDLDRAREHGDLVGPFGSVAEQLTATTAKFGLTGFGEKGDPFDPTRHEAVAHQTSAEVTEPTCVDVMRRGYLLGEKLLRPALVAVAEPE